MYLIIVEQLTVLWHLLTQTSGLQIPVTVLVPSLSHRDRHLDYLYIYF